MLILIAFHCVVQSWLAEASINMGVAGLPGHRPISFLCAPIVQRDSAQRSSVPVEKRTPPRRSRALRRLSSYPRSDYGGPDVFVICDKNVAKNNDKKTTAANPPTTSRTPPTTSQRTLISDSGNSASSVQDTIQQSAREIRSAPDGRPHQEGPRPTLAQPHELSQSQLREVFLPSIEQVVQQQESSTRMQRPSQGKQAPIQKSIAGPPTARSAAGSVVYKGVSSQEIPDKGSGSRSGGTIVFQQRASTTPRQGACPVQNSSPASPDSSSRKAGEAVPLSQRGGAVPSEPRAETFFSHTDAPLSPPRSPSLSPRSAFLLGQKDELVDASVETSPVRKDRPEKAGGQGFTMQRGGHGSVMPTRPEDFVAFVMPPFSPDRQRAQSQKSTTGSQQASISSPSTSSHSSLFVNPCTSPASGVVISPGEAVASIGRFTIPRFGENSSETSLMSSPKSPGIEARRPLFAEGELGKASDVLQGVPETTPKSPSLQAKFEDLRNSAKRKASQEEARATSIDDDCLTNRRTTSSDEFSSLSAERESLKEDRERPTPKSGRRRSATGSEISQSWMSGWSSVQKTRPHSRSNIENHRTDTSRSDPDDRLVIAIQTSRSERDVRAGNVAGSPGNRNFGTVASQITKLDSSGKAGHPAETRRRSDGCNGGISGISTPIAPVVTVPKKLKPAEKAKERLKLLESGDTMGNFCKKVDAMTIQHRGDEEQCGSRTQARELLSSRELARRGNGATDQETRHQHTARHVRDEETRHQDIPVSPSAASPSVASSPNSGPRVFGAASPSSVWPGHQVPVRFAFGPSSTEEFPRTGSKGRSERECAEWGPSEVITRTVYVKSSKPPSAKDILSAKETRDPGESLSFGKVTSSMTPSSERDFRPAKSPRSERRVGIEKPPKSPKTPKSPTIETPRETLSSMSTAEPTPTGYESLTTPTGRKTSTVVKSDIKSPTSSQRKVLPESPKSPHRRVLEAGHPPWIFSSEVDTLVSAASFSPPRNSRSGEPRSAANVSPRTGAKVSPRFIFPRSDKQETSISPQRAGAKREDPRDFTLNRSTCHVPRVNPDRLDPDRSDLRSHEQSPLYRLTPSDVPNFGSIEIHSVTPPNQSPSVRAMNLVGARQASPRPNPLYPYATNRIQNLDPYLIGSSNDAFAPAAFLSEMFRAISKE